MEKIFLSKRIVGGDDTSHPRRKAKKRVF